jgi:BirA family biotin operon repressor/biotin-[acetyl-CoA-carboxylase] ligase
VTGFQLGTKADLADYRLFGFDTVGSTSLEAVDLLKAGDAGQVWFAALQQTSGKGRRGRAWASPHGNLAASLLLTFPSGNNSLASLGFVAGVALIRAFGDVFPTGHVAFGLAASEKGQKSGLSEPTGPQIALKWPNDVLANGEKLAGILLEAHAMPSGGQAVVIGIGVNVVEAPTGLAYPTTCLSDLISGNAAGDKISAVQLFAALADNWVDIFGMWDEGRGLADVLDIWRENATGFGTKIGVNTPHGIVRGVFQDIDQDGRLLVRHEDGTLSTISAGDVHFGATASIKD